MGNSLDDNNSRTRPGVDKVKPKGRFKYSLQIDVRHGRPKVDPSCTEFVYPRFWHFDNGAIKVSLMMFSLNMVDYPHVLPLAVHLKFVWLDK